MKFDAYRSRSYRLTVWAVATGVLTPVCTRKLEASSSRQATRCCSYTGAFWNSLCACHTGVLEIYAFCPNFTFCCCIIRWILAILILVVANRPLAQKHLPEIDQAMYAVLCRECCERLMYSFRQGMSSSIIMLNTLFKAASSETIGKFVRAATTLLTKACNEADSPEPPLMVRVSSGQSSKVVGSRPLQLPLMSAPRNHSRSSAAMLLSVSFACGHLLRRTYCLQRFEVVVAISCNTTGLSIAQIECNTARILSSGVSCSRCAKSCT